MTSVEQFQSLLSNQIEYLHCAAIAACPNRKGLRERSGILLEDAFIDLATRLAPTLSVEIGAHEASFSSRLKTALPELHALAFEANPYVFHEHATRLRQNTPFVDYRHAAICGTDGTAELRIPSKVNGDPFAQNNPISSLHYRVSPLAEYQSVLVPSLMLDTALESYAIDQSVAWIDAEGSQKEILLGGHLYFTQVAAVYIEVEREAAWRDQIVRSEIAQALSEYSLVPIMQDNLATIQFNEVYVRNDRTIFDSAIDSVRRYTESLQDLVGTA